MKRFARSAVVTAVTMLTVTSTALYPIRPAPAPSPEPTVRLARAFQPTLPTPPPPGGNVGENSAQLLIAPPSPTAYLTATDLPGLLVQWIERIIIPPSASAPFPSPTFERTVVGNSIDSVVKNVYNAVEPWVEWGFDVAAYAVGWIPYVGWLAPQIEIFYNFGERIVRSITFNIADWLGGNISFWDGLVNVVVDTINSFIFLANDQLAFWLPPLPPIPPIGPFAAEAPEAGLMRMSSFDESTPPTDPGAKQGELLDQDPGEALNPGQGAGGEQLPGELAGEGSGELIEGDGEQIEEAVDSEETDPDLRIDGTDPDTTDKLTTTDSSGTVQAQGEIRSSAVATPGITSSQTQDTNSSPGAVLDEEPTDPTPAPSPQEPSTSDDGAQHATDDANGTTANAE
ncbi:hypothetical protein H7J93_17950 [Mycobacterium barrassiae]|uniref:hypothetical protein n=1 Tax=Mycobacterium barrassiae TaxID=319709 RepID=UPI002265ABCF|nr:hypothetical protein [Mycobacterium barrassiae]MCV7301506.1 hypothetical protein [Mycobacterium barrassiae]